MRNAPTYQPDRNVRVAYGVGAVIAALVLTEQARHWIHTGAIKWGNGLPVFGMLMLMSAGAFDIPYALRRFLLIVAVLSTACAFLFFGD